MPLSTSKITRRTASRLLAAVVGLGLAATPVLSVADAAPGLPPDKPLPGGKWVPQPTIGEFVEWSSWATLNEISNADCKGFGASRKLGDYLEYRTFHCTVKTFAGTKAAVTATALGPEWLKMSSAAGLKGDPGVGGAVPKGPHLWNDSDAEQALENSHWATSRDIDTASCEGIGAYKALPDEFHYGAFQCSTLHEGGPGPEALIRVLNARSAQVVRSINPINPGK